jgi:hypothetical protein
MAYNMNHLSINNKRLEIEANGCQYTFLNRKQEDDVFMEILEGFEGHGNPYSVYKLRRALCGLHQPPQAWYNHIDEELTLIGHKKSSIDFNSVGKGKYIILLFYINDLFFI